MDEAEKLVLVNSDDRPIGEILRGDTSQLTLHGDRYIRVVNAFIVRGDGKIWVPTRSTHKKLAPGGLDYSVGAHVGAGEEYLEALIREFNEEAGLVISASDCTEIAYSTPLSSIPPSIYFNKLFIVKTDKQPVLSDEHTAGEFLDIDTAIAKVEGGAIAKNHYLSDLFVLRQYLQKQSG